jgi:hypothetical protein
MHACIAQTLTELLPQNIFHALDHEINDRLRRVNDAVGICDLNGEALKESFIDAV